MRALQMSGCFSAVIRALLVTECLLTCVRGDGEKSSDELEIKYVLIGAGIGLFLAAVFLIYKVCIIRKHVRDNSRDARTKRPSEPHVPTLRPPSQSEPPVEVVSNDMQC